MNKNYGVKFLYDNNNVCFLSQGSFGKVEEIKLENGTSCARKTFFIKDPTL